MPLQKLTLKPGINRENTRYTSESGWYESDKIRFRQGTPESIGGWQRISANTFLGVCRSLWNWATLAGRNLMGVGTSVKFYIENGGSYYDVTPFRVVQTLTNPFTTVTGLATVTVTDINAGYADGDYVTFFNATAVGGLTISGQYRLSYASGTTYTITAATTASSPATGGGTVYAAYQINTGASTVAAVVGWGSSRWGISTWGGDGPASVAPTELTVWNQCNWGQDLIYNQRGGPLYYWNANVGVTPTTFTITIAAPAVVTSAVPVTLYQPVVLSTTGALPTGLIPGKTYYVTNIVLSTFNLSATAGGAAITTSGTQSGAHSILPNGTAVSTYYGATQVPLTVNTFLVSDASRFLLCFGTNDVFSTTYDPLLIRWSDQESFAQWSPAATNQAGSVRLSHGSKIITAMQSRQEIFVWTDQAVYSLQYLGPPYVWKTQLLGDNTSIISASAAAVASNSLYWMGADKFYMYNGTVQTLKCDLRQYVYDDINLGQTAQIFASTSEGFNEIWWFYCSKNSLTVDRYVSYNYVETVWQYGTMARTAWIDTGLRSYPVAATYSGNLVNHEYGVDDGEGAVALPINAFVQSAQFDIGDGDRFSFIWRMLPDITFRGSTDNSAPAVTMTLQPLVNSGSGYNAPKSVAGPNSNAEAVVTGVVPVDIDEFTGQVAVRVRGRQMSMRVESNKLGTHWQLGSPRIDIRADGRRG